VTTGTSGEPDRIWSRAPYRVGAVIWSLSRIARLRALLDFRGLAELLETAVVTGAKSAPLTAGIRGEPTARCA
jgi:hypothetical protein